MDDPLRRLAAIAVFMLTRLFDFAGDPNAWQSGKADFGNNFLPKTKRMGFF